jgi:CheY-like chemotaxis protein
MAQQKPLFRAMQIGISRALSRGKMEVTMIPRLPRILLVDDERQGLWLRAEVMKSCGFPVVTADSAIEAISLMAEEASGIDVAIVDYDMPVMNGCDLADQLRSMSPGLKIILYSGAIDIPEGEMTSLDAFICKNEGTDRLLAQIHQLTQIGAMTPVYAGADAEFYCQ